MTRPDSTGAAGAAPGRAVLAAVEGAGPAACAGGAAAAAPGAAGSVVWAGP
jgi:hypothetical protein